MKFKKTALCRVVKFKTADEIRALGFEVNEVSYPEDGDTKSLLKIKVKTPGDGVLRDMKQGDDMTLVLQNDRDFVLYDRTQHAVLPAQIHDAFPQLFTDA